MNPWIMFVLSAAAVVLAGRKLSQYGDDIATQTGLGRAFVGSILLAGATSLPEIVASVAAGLGGAGNLALGNVFGSNIFNVAILVLAQFAAARRILANVGQTHTVVAAAGIMLSGLAALAMVVRLPFAFLGAGVDAWVILLTYIFILRLLPREAEEPQVAAAAEPAPGGVGLLWLKFAGAAAVVVVSGWFLSVAADRIAVITGLGQTFVGSTLLAAVTSLPELTVTIFTAGQGLYDLALGNVLGSNIFNMVIIVLADFALPGGTILSVASRGQIIAALAGLVMSGIAVVALASSPLLGAEAKEGARFRWEAYAIAVTYAAATYLLFVLR
ncbi:MAG: sodium:calcium antiporter [Bacillota bacterium]